MFRTGPSQVFAVCLLCFVLPSCQAITGYFWQLTDLHYDPTYPVPGISCVDTTSSGNSRGQWGDFNCDAPWRMVYSSIKNMKFTGGAPDYVAWTGGTVYHRAPNVTVSTPMVLEILQNTTNLLAEYFHDVPLVVALGATDYPEAYQLPGVQNPVYSGAADMWRTWLNSTHAYDTFTKGAYYTRKLRTGVRIIVLNTVLYHKLNAATRGHADPAGQLAWLRATLTAARAQTERVHMFAHVPPGISLEEGGKSDLTKEFNDILVQILHDYRDVIHGTFTGHDLLDFFRLVNNNGKATSVVFGAPSVSPRKKVSTAGIVGRVHNPGFRKITYDRESGEPSGIDQYYINLTDANARNRENWIRLYNFAGSYNIYNISAQSMGQLAVDFQHFAGEKFHRYFNHYQVGARDAPYHPCSCLCKFNHICAIRNLDEEGFSNCDNLCSISASKVLSFSYFVSFLFVTMSLLLSRAV